MKKKTLNKYPLTIRGMGVQLTKERIEMRESMVLLEKEAHQNGLEIAKLTSDVDHLDVERARLNVKVSEKGLKVKESAEKMKVTEDWFEKKLEEQRDRLQSITDRLRLVYIVSGIAFGAALIFSIILLGAIMNVGSGGQITILFP